MEIEFNELLSAVEDEKVRRWLWNQLPERSRLEGDSENYVITSLRLVYDPPCDEWIESL